MNSKKVRSGKCLCGCVEISIPYDMIDLGVCHCFKCQKWSGGPLMEIECGTSVEFSGEENIGTFKSSKWAKRGFCQRCGSHLFIKDVDSGEYGIPPGIFDNHQDIQLNRQVFFDHKPQYYNFSEQTKNITSEFIYTHFPQTKEDKG